MLRRRLSGSNFVILVWLLVCGGGVKAQTSAPGRPAQAQSKDPVDLKLQEALRERDAIIRNLLERVSELEWRVNGGFTSAAKPEERPVMTGAANSRAINSVVSTSTYDVTERQATEALDQALIVRGGLLLPSGTMEIDNTTSFLSSSSDHLTVNGFAL